MDVTPSKVHDIEEYLVVGSAALVNTDPRRKEGTRYKTTVRGWHKGACLILDMPKEESVPILRGQMCGIRFFSGGEACGFDARVLSSGSRAHPFFLVEWPKEVEVVAVRKYERLDTALPCTVALEDGSSYPGTVTDLSAGGCGLEFSPAQKEGTPVSVSFKLPDGSLIQDMDCVVRNMRHAPQASARCSGPQGSARGTPQGGLHGCEFEDGQDVARKEIEFFISTTHARLHATKHTTRRAVFIEKKPDEATLIEGILRGRGLDVAVVSTVVDGFFQLRIACPDVLLVGWTQDMLSGLDICRVVRGTRGLEILPIILYGGEEPALEKEACQAGATHYFPSISMTERIVEAVLQYIQGPAQSADQPPSAPPSPSGEHA